MSQTLPRTVEEAIDLYLKERATHPEMLPISGRHEVLRWFFDHGKMAGIQDAVKHIALPTTAQQAARTRAAREARK